MRRDEGGGFSAVDVSDRIELRSGATPEGVALRLGVPTDLFDWTPRPVSRVGLDVGYAFGPPAPGEPNTRSTWHTGTRLIENAEATDRFVLGSVTIE